MSVGQSLIVELEEAIEGGSKEKRVDSFRRVTDLFVADADRLTDQQIEVFDDILGHLIKRIESKALAELAAVRGRSTTLRSKWCAGSPAITTSPSQSRFSPRRRGSATAT